MKTLSPQLERCILTSKRTKRKDKIVKSEVHKTSTTEHVIVNLNVIEGSSNWKRSNIIQVETETVKRNKISDEIDYNCIGEDERKLSTNDYIEKR